MIISNDPYYNGASNPYYLALTSGDNTSDMPPVAVAKAPDGDVQKAKDTELPKTITLDGSGSTDTDATPIASYEWKLVAVPKGSALTPNSAPMSRTRPRSRRRSRPTSTAYTRSSSSPPTPSGRRACRRSSRWA